MLQNAKSQEKFHSTAKQSETLSNIGYGCPDCLNCKSERSRNGGRRRRREGRGAHSQDPPRHRKPTTPGLRRLQRQRLSGRLNLRSLRTLSSKRTEVLSWRWNWENRKCRSSKPQKDEERETRKAIVEDAGKTEGKDRDLVHGDGANAWLASRPRPVRSTGDTGRMRNLSGAVGGSIVAKFRAGMLTIRIAY
jgi:hypothetical protein